MKVLRFCFFPVYLSAKSLLEGLSMNLVIRDKAFGTREIHHTLKLQRAVLVGSPRGCRVDGNSSERQCSCLFFISKPIL